MCSLRTLLLVLSKALFYIPKQAVDVIVCTARIALDAIIHAYLKLEDVNLVIFDEAHHALGDDDYARLMAHYRLLPEDSRPKIFGMTASPLSSKGDLESACVRLERALDARIFTAPLETQQELRHAVSRPDELIVEYEKPSKPFVDYESPHSVRREVIKRMKPSTELDKILDRMTFYWEEYGPVFSDLAWLASRKDLRHKAVLKDFSALQQEHTSLLNPAITEERQRLEAAASTSRQIVSILETIEPPEVIELDQDNASPKLLKLIEILKCFEPHAECFCGILFCSRRLAAQALTLLILKTPSLSWLHPEALVGHGGRGDIAQADGMSWEEQKSILSRLRNRNPTNLVIATSVLEEGLDITPVNCVIRFDLPQHHIAYVQSKGRARAAHSTFVLLAEKDNEDHFALLERFAYAEDTMKEFLASLPQDRVAHAVDDDREDFDEANHLESRSLVDDSTGARLWPVDATVVLANYVSLLKSDEFCPGGPDYEFTGEDLAWTVTVRMPASSPAGTTVGPIMRSRLAAKRAAAFEACCLLHKLGELDQNLSPRRALKVPVEPQAPLTGDFTDVGVKVDGAPENTLSFKPAIPAVFDHPGIPPDAQNLEVYWHVLPVPSTNCLGEPMRSVALVTMRPIAHGLPGVVLTEYRGQKNVQADPIGQPHNITLTRGELDAARAYSLKLLQIITRRTFLCDDLPYLILPLQNDCSGIAWEEVYAAQEPVRHVQTMSLTTDALNDHLLFDGRDVMGGACPHRMRLVDSDKTPLSLYPNPTGTFRSETFVEHRCKRMKDKGRAPNLDALKAQPIIVVRRLSRRLENFLTTATKKAISEVKDSYLIPEWTWVESIRASMFESGSLLPSLLCGLEHLLLGQEINCNVLERLVDPREMTVALMHTTAQLPFTLERYEFLGDVILKALASSYVYALFRDCAEGDLHWERREIINNMNLIAKTKHLDLGSRICTFTFTRKSWRPPLCEIKERPIDPVDELQHFGYKTIADVVESIVGAAVMTGNDLADPHRDPEKLWQNIPVALKTLCNFDVIPREYDTMASIVDVWKNHVAVRALVEGWDSRLHKESLYRFQDLIGYEFKHPHLALEAMTHPGHLRTSLPSYQRLEFLGDAILEFCVDSWLFTTYPGLDEGELTSIKDVAVANRTLCALCEHLTFHKYLQFDLHSGFAEALSNLVMDMEVARCAVDRHFGYSPLPPHSKKGRESEEAQGLTDAGVTLQSSSSGGGGEGDGDDKEVPYRQYWAKQKEIKALADIVESTLGAVFVDSGFSFETAWKFWTRLYLPWYSRYADYDALLEARDRGVAIRQRACVSQPCHPPLSLQLGNATRSHPAEADE